jgi:two-component system response regulator ResD
MEPRPESRFESSPGITRDEARRGGHAKVKAGAKRLVIVADDDAGIRHLVALHLRRLGCTVLEAPDGGETLRLVLEHEPDLLILDVGMPGLSGYAVTREVRRMLTARVPVMLMRGSDLSADISEAFEAGADAYLKKPFTSEELREQVQALLAAS